MEDLTMEIYFFLKDLEIDERQKNLEIYTVNILPLYEPAKRWWYKNHIFTLTEAQLWNQPPDICKGKCLI